MALDETQYKKLNKELKNVWSMNDRLYAKLNRLNLRINSMDKVNAAQQKVAAWLPKWVPNTTVVAVMFSAGKDSFNAKSRAALYGDGIGGQACTAISKSLALANFLIGCGSRENL
ncbi:MAG: hypothetical protein FJX22_01645 [Alphaproteobacteria bacterium]|nr:hypothetical protein [Alphaproteobacteria bacterium]